MGIKSRVNYTSILEEVKLFTYSRLYHVGKHQFTMANHSSAELYIICVVAALVIPWRQVLAFVVHAIIVKN